jgi:hypothetical protein
MLNGNTNGSSGGLNLILVSGGHKQVGPGAWRVVYFLPQGWALVCKLLCLFVSVFFRMY